MFGDQHDNIACVKVKGAVVERDGMGRKEGGGFRVGNTCIPVADSF